VPAQLPSVFLRCACSPFRDLHSPFSVLGGLFLLLRVFPRCCCWPQRERRAAAPIRGRASPHDRHALLLETTRPPAASRRRSASAARRASAPRRLAAVCTSATTAPAHRPAAPGSAHRAGSGPGRRPVLPRWRSAASVACADI